jgi:tetratricopeptide (TPR) repeat protein
MSKKRLNVESRAATESTQKVRAAQTTKARRSPIRAKWQRGLIALTPGMIALIASINSLWNGFAIDDQQQIQNNPFIKDLHNLPLAFTTSVWSFASGEIFFSVDSYFRPLFNVLLSISYPLFGNAAWGWHLSNVLIHTAATLLVYAVVREITDHNWIGLIGASLFAVHPVHAESVAWASGVTDPLMTVFLLSAFYFYLRYRKTNRKYLMAVALGSYLLALLSKETAIALPLVIAYCEFSHFNEDTVLRRRIVRVLAMGSLFLAPTVAYFALRYHALGSLFFPAGPRYPLGPALATVPIAIAKYLLLLVVPTGYNYQHYTAFVETAGSPRFFAPLVLVALVCAGIAWNKSRVLKFASVWFIALLLPSLAALRQFDQEYLVQERYLYAPSIGFCLAVAFGIEWVANRRRLALKGEMAKVALAAVFVVVWGSFCVRQNQFWYDTITVYKRCVAVAPRSAEAHVSLSRAYQGTGKVRDAETEALTALELDPACAAGYLDLSYYATRAGKLDKAIEYLEKGTEAVPEGPFTRHNLATIYLNLGLLYSQRKEYDRAEQTLLRSIEISPRAVAWYYTGQFYFDRSRYDDARAMYEKTLARVPPWFAAIHLKLGLVFQALNDTSRAEYEFEKYLELAPAASDLDDVKRRITAIKGAGPPS